MRDRKLAARYARALLGCLPEPADAERADAFLMSLAEASSRSAELRDVLLNPAVSRPARKKVLGALADAADASVLVKNFLFVLADHGRVGALPEIAVVFHEEREERERIVPAVMTTARPMTGDMEERARAALERLTGKKVRLTLQHDPDLLGGAVTRIGSLIYDGSLRTQLDSLKRKMAEG